jgi:hypothetical protein
MQRVLCAGLSCLALLAAPRLVHGVAVMIRPVPTIQQRVLSADVIVVGKVMAIDDKMTKAERFAGDKQLGDYRIATVKISERINGANGLTHIKVGMQPPVAQPIRPIGPGGPIGGPIRPIRPIRGPFGPQDITLTKGQEVCLFLKPHHKENFYVATSAYAALDKKAANFDKDLAEVRKCVKVLAEPMVALKAKSAEDRFQAAALLLQHYRTFKMGGKQEPISADESKLILEAIADGNWTTPRIIRPGMPQQMTAQTCFYMLGLQPKDGWMQPQNFQQFPDAAKAWLKANAGTYRIQRYVTAKTEK